MNDDYKNYLNYFNLNNSKINEYQNLLKNSLFYYCCGKDPSPIIAFKHNYPLYIYVDKKNYQEDLYNQLSKHNFKLINKQTLNLPHTTLTIWKYNNNIFYLLYANNDARKIFEIFYLENKLLPKCICNYRYELPNRYEIEQAEKNVLYILGHCFDQNYQLIDQYDYYGDYSFNQNVKISLFKKEVLL